jgi:hypothetical protein
VLGYRAKFAGIGQPGGPYTDRSCSRATPLSSSRHGGDECETTFGAVRVKVLLLERKKLPLQDVVLFMRNRDLRIYHQTHVFAR